MKNPGEKDTFVNAQRFHDFIKDARILIDSCENDLLLLEKKPDDTEAFDRLFRQVHSLKTEASFFDVEVMTGLAHEMENILAKTKKKEVELEPAVMNVMLEAVDSLNDIVIALEDGQYDKINIPKSIHETLVQINESGRLIPIMNERKNLTQQFTKFENDLLFEARKRGEPFYRIMAYIDQNEKLKYARAFLLLNNLEMHTNVIRTSPPIKKENSQKLDVVTFFVTCELPDRDIYKLLDVDQVNKVELARISYDSFLPGNSRKMDFNQPESKSCGRPSSTIPVKAASLDTMASCSKEILLEVSSLQKQFKKSSKDNEAARFEKLGAMIKQLDASIAELRKVPLSIVFSRIPRTVRDLSRETAKKVSCKLEPGGISIERTAADLLYEPLVQIVKNAVDHGIEKPAARLSAGKKEYGTIELLAEKDKHFIYIRIIDDGAGIMADIQKLENGKGESLISILARPGFTTREEADTYSGRGIGLDVVVQNLKRIPGADISLSTKPGYGCVFTLIIPTRHTIIDLLFFRNGTQTYCVPKANCVDTINIDTSKIVIDEESLTWSEYDGGKMPMYSLNGRIWAKDHTTIPQTGLVLSYMDKRIILTVDEFLFEQEFSGHELSIGAETEPFLHTIHILDKEQDYLYVSPVFFAENRHEIKKNIKDL